MESGDSGLETRVHLETEQELTQVTIGVRSPKSDTPRGSVIIFCSEDEFFSHQEWEFPTEIHCDFLARSQVDCNYNDYLFVCLLVQFGHFCVQFKLGRGKGGNSLKISSGRRVPMKNLAFSSLAGG